MIAFIAGLLVGAALTAVALPLLHGALLWREVRADDAEALQDAVVARVIEMDRTADAAGN